MTCPWHGWQWDATTGIHCMNDQMRVGSFEVRVEGDDILVAG
ncbi:MAG: hypothetical protein O7B99_05575 [Planctomycetota bacterium]|nr:hypothetical protein [Planctomycetota bacterium]